MVSEWVRTLKHSMLLDMLIYVVYQLDGTGSTMQFFISFIFYFIPFYFTLFYVFVLLNVRRLTFTKIYLKIHRSLTCSPYRAVNTLPRLLYKLVS